MLEHIEQIPICRLSQLSSSDEFITTFWRYHSTVNVNISSKIYARLVQCTLCLLFLHRRMQAIFCYTGRKRTATSSLHLPNFPIYHLKSFLHPPESFQTFGYISKTAQWAWETDTMPAAAFKPHRIKYVKTDYVYAKGYHRCRCLLTLFSSLVCNDGCRWCVI